MKKHSLPLITVAFALSLVVIAGVRGPRALAQRTELKSLGSVFDVASGGVRDTNGDGLADSVVARVIVPARASAQDIEAATNIAARLGFETTAMTLPIVVRDNAVGDAASIALPILIGRTNTVVQTLADAGTIDVKSLRPGQGLVATVRSPLGGADGVVVVGGDDDGTLAAGIELAGRLPRLWGMNAMTVRGLEEQLVQYLRGKAITASDARVRSLVVDSDDRGLEVVKVTVEVPRDAARAARALEDLDALHRRGLEPKALNFANTAVTAVEIQTQGKTVAKAEVHRSGLNQRTLTPPIDPDELAPDSPTGRGGPGAQVVAGPTRAFDLRRIYSIEGWYGDAYRDLIPDSTETAIVLGGGQDALAAAHIAARVGLETTGVTLPITREASEVRDPAREPSPILVGRNNSLTDQLVKIGKARVDGLQAGEGVIQIVPRAFGNTPATVVSGADEAGVEAAAMYLARRVPYLWDNARGAASLDDVATQTSRFLEARNGAGQAAQIVGEIDRVLASLKDKTVESFDVKMFVESADPALEKFVAGRVGTALKLPSARVTSRGITDPETVFEDKIDVPWEVDDFWATFRSDVLPKVKSGSTVELEARLSESPEVRKQLVGDITSELTKAGAASPKVRVLSAYKQGYLWMTEQVIPELKGKAAKSIRIKVANYHPDLTKKYKFYQVPTRWLHELYPVDDIFLRELGISKEAFALEVVDNVKDTYTLEATDAAGKVVYRGAFSPKTVEREYLDKFPGWSRVDVTTGWISATIDGQLAADSRIATDPERFWDYYQAKVLPRVYDNVMKVTENRPTPAKQPFHRDLDVEVWMSEPDFAIGIDQELISSLESLHEDIYFVTLDFFDALGRTTVRQRLRAPGKIFPIIHPNRPGQAGQARILYAGNAAVGPRLEVSYQEKGVEKPTHVNRPLTKIDTTPPLTARAVVRADRVSEIELQVEARDDHEASRAADAIDALAELQAAGVYKTALSYEHVDRIALAIAAKDARTRRVVRNTGAWPASNVRTAVAAAPRQRIVTWDHVISPDEAEEIVGKLAAFPEVKAYKAGKSYRGREVSIVEITQPTASEQVSLAKLSAYKPTIFITARQHANEVSSTSHSLRLAELLCTDPAYKAILKKVNVIIQPVENPDGAQMAFELQKLTPTYILHAGRYSSLGMDVGSGVGEADPLLPESLVRMRVWSDWLPDVYLNPHGYPAHEWVQQFAGYVPPGFRSYLSTRGWYTGGSGLRDPRYPGHMDASDAIRENIVREINSNADVRAMNLRSQARYRRWAYGFSPFLFNQEIYKDTAIYYTDPESGQPTGSRRAGGGRGGGGGRGMGAWPQVTWHTGGTEAPDETAQGEWMNVNAKAGFSYLMANIRYLNEGRYDVQRIEEDGQRNSVQLTMLRVRPVLPGR